MESPLVLTIGLIGLDDSKSYTCFKICSIAVVLHSLSVSTVFSRPPSGLLFGRRPGEHPIPAPTVRSRDADATSSWCPAPDGPKSLLAVGRRAPFQGREVLVLPDSSRDVPGTDPQKGSLSFPPAGTGAGGDRQAGRLGTVPPDAAATRTAKSKDFHPNTHAIGTDQFKHMLLTQRGDCSACSYFCN